MVGWTSTPRGTLALGESCPSSLCNSAHLESPAKVCASERCGGPRAAFRRVTLPGWTTMTSGSRTCRPAPNWCRKGWERRTSGRGPHSAGSSGANHVPHRLQRVQALIGNLDLEHLLHREAQVDFIQRIDLQLLERAVYPHV